MAGKGAEFSLHQKIFVIKSFYRFCENLSRIRSEFDDKFHIQTADTIFQSFQTVVQSFEDTGSVRTPVYFDVQQPKPSQPSPVDEEDGQEDIVIEEEVVQQVIALDDEDSYPVDIVDEDVDPPASYYFYESILGTHATDETKAAATRQAIPTGHGESKEEQKQDAHPPTNSNSQSARNPSRIQNFTHVCTYCPKTFSSNAALTVHIRTHTGERPFKCFYCSKSFKQKGARQVHHRRHTGETPYVCTFCDKGFKQSINLQCHIKSVHGEAINTLIKKEPKTS